MLTYIELNELIDEGCIEGVPRENVNGASIDLTLGSTFWVERRSDTIIDLALKEAPRMQEIVDKPLFLNPGEFALACTREVFNLPNDVSALFVLKSSLARAGLNHLNAGFADPCWNGSVLTLEYQSALKKNVLKLTPGMKCGQMLFWYGEPVPEEASYAVRGQYNGDLIAQRSKGVR